MEKSMLWHARITGTGSFLPEQRITNADLEKMVDTNDEWIQQRTGIIERRKVAENEATSDMALRAAKIAISDAGLQPEDIDQIIVATVSPDTIFPATACRLQSSLGCRQIMAFDLAAACSGFIYALGVANNAIVSGMAKHILVVGAECLTRFTDYSDRGTCILFGDGAGAVVLSRVEDENPIGIIDLSFASDGSGGDLMELPGIGSKHPPTAETVAEGLQFIKINGRAVYKHAINKIVSLVNGSLERCGMTHDDIDLIIPHQMNARIIESSAKHLEVPLEKVFINIDKYGNTSAATIPIAIDEACRQGKLKRGDTVVLVAFGGGMTWASAMLRW